MTMQQIHHIDNILNDKDIELILGLPEVICAKEEIDSFVEDGVVRFSVTLPVDIETKLANALGVTGFSSYPMRWIKGDTRAHIDSVVGGEDIGGSFENTHLVYLTDSSGEFLIGEESFSISKGSAFIFSHGLRHETVSTGNEPRLLIGPMNEEGKAVGAPGIYQDGDKIIYIRHIGTDVEYSIDKTNWYIFYFPCIIHNTDTTKGTLKVYFETDITLTDVGHYFICDSDYIQFGSENLKPDGHRPIIHINVDNYDGLIQNGNNITSGYSNISIFNLVVNGGNYTTQVNGGWIGKSYFGGSNNLIVNCSSIGNIGENGGGIVGSNAGTYGGGFKITMCSSSGIIGMNAGGIVGAESNILISTSWSTGAISGNYAGGIIGANSNGFLLAGCYSTGVISGNSAGGIIGSNPGLNDSSVFVSYSTGAITGSGSGGICGAISANCITSIYNCYTLGHINGNGNAGGICGIITASDPNISISSCYIAGGITTTNKGYIIGNSTNDDSNYTDCYSEAFHGGSSWNDTNANVALGGTPSSTPGSGYLWSSISANTPYEITPMGYTPYSLNNISYGPTYPYALNLNQYVVSSVSRGGSTNSAIISGKFYRLMLNGGDGGTITINSNTGIISTTSNTLPGTYFLLIRNVGYNSSYNYSIVILIVESSIMSIPMLRTPLYSDNSLVYYKLHSLSSGIGTIKNYRARRFRT